MTTETSQTNFQYTSPSIVNSDVMSLSLVLTVQPWFMNLMQNLRENLLTQQVSSPLTQQEMDAQTSTLLEILGYCPCQVPSSSKLGSLEISGEKGVLEQKPDSSVLKNSLTHDSFTKSVSQKPGSEGHEHRKDDEYLLDIHPHETRYFTNPKTGRKVKKLVCLVPG